MAEGASWKVKWVESRLFYLNKQQSTEPLTMYVPSYSIESDWCHLKCFECTQPLDLGYWVMCGRHHCCVICDWETVDLDVGSSVTVLGEFMLLMGIVVCRLILLLVRPRKHSML
jgi:hypothetical protein